MENEDNESFRYLKDTGILVEHDGGTIYFSSPLAKRYNLALIFPNRSQSYPSSLFALIKNVISTMSANILQKSTISGDFPNESVFQHLFMEGIALNTPPECYICPQLSKIFPPNTNLSSHEAINGEAGFYLNGKMCWGVELLVNGAGIEYHIPSFTPPKGKYAGLSVEDYVVVDFRRTTSGHATNIIRHANRITVFFRTDDYSSVECIFGDEDGISLTLAA